MGDSFFDSTHCDRCRKDLKGCRTMSWFTTETICMDCSVEERNIRKELPSGGTFYEGCGYIPDIKKKKN
jgi:hypothetical protein